VLTAVSLLLGSADRRGAHLLAGEIRGRVLFFLRANWGVFFNLEGVNPGDTGGGGVNDAVTPSSVRHDPNKDRTRDKDRNKGTKRARGSGTDKADTITHYPHPNFNFNFSGLQDYALAAWGECNGGDLPVHTVRAFPQTPQVPSRAQTAGGTTPGVIAGTGTTPTGVTGGIATCTFLLSVTVTLSPSLPPMPSFILPFDLFLPASVNHLFSRSITLTVALYFTHYPICSHTSTVRGRDKHRIWVWGRCRDRVRVKDRGNTRDRDKDRGCEQCCEGVSSAVYGCG
jgi:hypothetical protein